MLRPGMDVRVRERDEVVVARRVSHCGVSATWKQPPPKVMNADASRDATPIMAAALDKAVLTAALPTNAPTGPRQKM